MTERDLEARIAVLSDALKSISKNTCCDNCQEAARVARSALGAYVGLARDHSGDVAQPTPDSDKVREMAAWLIALGDADDHKPIPDSLITWARVYVNAGLTEKHSGDCTDESHSCVVCGVSNYMEKAEQILKAFAAQPPAAPVGKPAGCDPCSYPECECWKAPAPQRLSADTVAQLREQNAELREALRLTRRALKEEMDHITESLEQTIPAQPQEVPQRDPMLAAVASLAAAISLLERTPRAKKAAPSDKMFDQMLADYRKALANARDALALSRPHGASDSASGASTPDQSRS